MAAMKQHIIKNPGCLPDGPLTGNNSMTNNSYVANMRRGTYNDTISANTRHFDHGKCISVHDNLSKKAETQIDPNLSEKPIIPPECTLSQNEDFLDKHIRHNHVQDHGMNIAQRSNNGYLDALTDGTNSQLIQRTEYKETHSRLNRSPISPARENAMQGRKTDRKEFGADITNSESPFKSNGSYGMGGMHRFDA